MIPKRYTILPAKILFVIMPPLATKFMKKVLKVGAKMQFKMKFNKIYLALKKQSNVINHLREVVPSYRLESWHKQIRNLPPNIFAFCQKGLIFSVAHNSNLQHW